jgi:hypothetical protein
LYTVIRRETVSTKTWQAPLIDDTSRLIVVSDAASPILTFADVVLVGLVAVFFTSEVLVTPKYCSVDLLSVSVSEPRAAV